MQVLGVSQTRGVFSPLKPHPQPPIVIITLTFYEAYLIINAKNPTFIYRQFWAFRGLTGLSPQTIYWGSGSDPRGVLLSLDPLCSAHFAAKPRLCYYRQLTLTLTLIILTIIIIMCMPRPGAWLSSRIASTYRGFELVARQWTDQYRPYWLES